MEEYRGLTATMSVYDCGQSDPFRLRRGAGQGRMSSPCIFRTVLDIAVAGCLSYWERRGIGLLLENGKTVNHVIWADNIWLAESDRLEALTMFKDLTEALMEWHMHWQVSSLELLASASEANNVVEAAVHVKGGGTLLAIKAVEPMKVLGI